MVSAGPEKDWGTEWSGQPLLWVTWESCLPFLSMGLGHGGPVYLKTSLY